MLAGRAVQAKACAKVTVPLMAAPFPAPQPTIATLSPMGARGNPGRVAHAVRFSIQDGISQVNAGLNAGLTGIQGVRRGFVSVADGSGDTARFTSFSDTKGVAITGTLRIAGNAITGRVSVDGPGKLDGALRLYNRKNRAWYAGSIGGTRVHIAVR